MQTDSQATERVRSIVARSKLDRVAADLLWNADTAADMRAIIRARLAACGLPVARGALGGVRACGGCNSVLGAAALAGLFGVLDLELLWRCCWASA